jgi:PAP2 superfamily protein
MVRKALLATLFSWLSFAVMTVLAVWNEGRPGIPFHDPILAAVPYVARVDAWNYWIWLLAWLPGIAAVLVASPPTYVRLMIAAGICSLLRGIAIVATGLAPVNGIDANAALAWDWALRWRVVLQILNPLSVFFEDSAHIWLTKDLFFSGHTASTFLLVLFGWPFRRLRWPFVAAHLVVVASLFLGHIHYTIDVAGGYAAAALAYACLRPRIRAAGEPVARALPPGVGEPA